MNTRAIQLATGLLALGFVLIGPSCGSIPEGRKYLSADTDAGGDTGGSSGAGGRATGGRSTGGRNTGGGNVAGSGSGGVNLGGSSGGVGTGGGGGAGPCGNEGQVCDTNGECCGFPDGASCVSFSGQPSAGCAPYCTLNSECASRCCVLLTNGKGACHPDASACGAACASLDETCDAQDDCCSGYTCVTQFTQGPKLCRPSCATNADCAPDLCVPDAAGQGACARAEVGLCSDTCTYAGDQECDDGGDATTVTSLCTLGTDCADCGPRVGGNSLCDDSCGRNNGLCEDGGTGSNGAACFFGEDCTDCGPRSSICVDTCFSANNGRCDYDQACDPGTDCTDCGPFYGGRGENPCDGSFSDKCTPFGASRDSVGFCDCNDCAWDQADCGTPNQCNGSTISACCGATNSCGIGNDGVCDCGGWCSWEGQDCGGGGSVTPACDPAQFAGCDTCMRTNCGAALSGCTAANCMPEFQCAQCCLSAQLAGGGTPDVAACAEQCSPGGSGVLSQATLNLFLCVLETDPLVGPGCFQCLLAGPVPVP